MHVLICDVCVCATHSFLTKCQDWSHVQSIVRVNLKVTLGKAFCSSFMSLTRWNPNPDCSWKWPHPYKCKSWQSCLVKWHGLPPSKITKCTATKWLEKIILTKLPKWLQYLRTMDPRTPHIVREISNDDFKTYSSGDLSIKSLHSQEFSATRSSVDPRLNSWPKPEDSFGPHSC